MLVVKVKLYHSVTGEPATAALNRWSWVTSQATTPTLLPAGARDRCTPAGQAREFYQALIGHGVDSELVIYPGEGHGVSRFPAITDYLTRLVTWFEKYMPA